MQLEKDVKITNKLGIHVRPASRIADTANKFKSKITFIKDGFEVNARSIIELLTLAAGQNTAIKIKSEGEDAEAALQAIVNLIESNFEEKNNGNKKRDRGFTGD
ncbi:MAG: HPr family phosphocarrier protein [Planctomycetes bacterium]|nr:HPr family phosphocarrier protein [Planctomycetota bacterium]MCK5579005.1 HPr family phosphocarrier protein [Planctomycetota bacterium]